MSGTSTGQVAESPFGGSTGGSTQSPFASAPYNPLTQQHCDSCSKVIQTSYDALQLAKKCRDCGYPVDDIIAQLEAQMKQATQIKAQFFPTQS